VEHLVGIQTHVVEDHKKMLSIHVYIGRVNKYPAN